MMGSGGTQVALPHFPHMERDTSAATTELYIYDGLAPRRDTSRQHFRLLTGHGTVPPLSGGGITDLPRTEMQHPYHTPIRNDSVAI
jgi:hypothetical protein